MAGKIKTIFRDQAGVLRRPAQANLEKLFSRLERGQMSGDGDQR